MYATQRVIVGVTSRFLGSSPPPEPGRYRAPAYSFRYDVQLNNARTSPVRVLRHDWHFQDEEAVIDSLEAEGTRATTPAELLQISGEGLGGDRRLGPDQSVIQQGKALRFTGVVKLTVPHAVGHGSLTVEVGRGEEITVRIDHLRFSSECGD